MKPLILIPARMASTRLPGKPLADIGGKPMIVRVAERAQLAGVGPVVVATDDQSVYDTVRGTGFQAVMTRDDHQSGSDRIYEALGKLDPRGDIGIVVNVQGDLPLLNPSKVRAVVRLLEETDADIGTLATRIQDAEEKTNPNVVKVVGTSLAPRRMRALYFTRATAPWGDGPLYHHIGIYAYRRAALERFVALPPSTLEKRERLEQLRALENGMTIMVGISDGVPLGVDTPADLERARAQLARGKEN